MVETTDCLPNHPGVFPLECSQEKYLPRGQIVLGPKGRIRQKQSFVDTMFTRWDQLVKKVKANSPLKSPLLKSPSLKINKNLTSIPSDGKINNITGEYLQQLQYIRTIGSGNFGQVKLVKQLETGKYFALKVLNKINLVKKSQVQNTINEKLILMDLNSPRIVQMYSTFSCEQNLYMLLEWVPGGDLFTHLRHRGRFSDNVCQFIIGNVVLALEYLHSVGVVHRDLKPENLLIDCRGYLKLTDLGFAKRLSSDRTYTECGTPDYVAPEIIRKIGHNHMIDWWSLGILLYELSAGFPPFSTEIKTEKFRKILGGRVVFPSFFSQQLKDLITGLLQVDSSCRLGSQNGAKDIKSQPWFADFDWVALARGTMPAPPILFDYSDNFMLKLVFRGDCSDESSCDSNNHPSLMNDQKEFEGF